MILGTGSSCIVFKRGNTAVKCYSNNITPNALVRELFFLQLLSHRNIVEIKSSYMYRGSVNIKMEYFGTSLFYLSDDTLSDKKLRLPFIMRDIMSALSYIHSLGILHRDVAPTNILVYENQAKLCDFGNSAICSYYTESMINVNFEDPEPIKTSDTDYYCLSRSILFYMGQYSPNQCLSGNWLELFQMCAEKRILVEKRVDIDVIRGQVNRYIYHRSGCTAETCDEIVDVIFGSENLLTDKHLNIVKRLHFRLVPDNISDIIYQHVNI